MRLPSILLAALMCTIASGTLWADEKPFRLQVLDSEFEKEFATKAATLDAKYRNALVALLAEFKAAGNLDGIVAVNAEIVSLDAKRAKERSSGTTTTSQPRLTLAAGSATPSGNVRFDGQHGLLVSWKERGGAAWSLEGLPAGKYTATLHYYAGPFAGGKLQLVVGEASKALAIKGSRSWKEAKSMSTGSITVGSEPGALTLSIVEARTIGVLELLRVELVREGD